MTSAVLELILFSLPSVFYARALRRQGRTSTEARTAVGWDLGDRGTYVLAIAVSAVLLPITYLALRAIPSGSLHTSSNLHVTYGRASTAGDYLAIAVLAVAEEILFRGLLGGIFMRRYGFAIGNVLQALVFLAPHLLLLAVSTALWPILPVQLVSGWLLGWLRWRSASIGPSSLAHVAANVLAPLLLTL
jgi:membrane protease YdiL (CAAX protease family)